MSENKDHPEETPTERLLREAFTARAGQVTAQSLRPFAPPKTRIRRLRPVYTVVVPLFGLAAGVLGYFTVNGTPTAMHQDPPPAASITASPSPAASDSASPSPSLSPSASSSASATGDTGGATASTATPFAFQGVKFRLPPGWTTRAHGSELCVVPPNAPTTAKVLADCEPYGISVTAYTTADEVRHETFPAPFDVEFESGWAHQPSCFSWDNPHTQGADGQVEMQTTQSYGMKVETLSNHQAREATWKVKCASGDTFTARRWDFAKQRVFVMSRGLKADYENDLQSILHSLDLSGVPDNLGATPEDGASLRRDGVGNTCGLYQVQQSDPGMALMAQVLTAARSRDYAALTVLYKVAHTDKNLADQQKLWHQDGVLDQLAQVLTQTHLATTDGQTWPAFTFEPQPQCVTDQADMALFDIAKPSDYHGVVTSTYDNGDGTRWSWNGIQLR